MGPPAQLPRVRSQGQMETSRPWASITWACRTRRASSSGCGTDAEVKGGERKERGVCVCGAQGSCQEAAGPTPGPFPPAPGGLEMGRSLPRVPALRLRSGRRRGGGGTCCVPRSVLAAAWDPNSPAHLSPFIGSVSPEPTRAAGERSGTWVRPHHHPHHCSRSLGGSQAARPPPPHPTASVPTPSRGPAEPRTPLSLCPGRPFCASTLPTGRHQLPSQAASGIARPVSGLPPWLCPQLFRYLRPSPCLENNLLVGLDPGL